jgi:3-dehydroquinate synthase
VVRPPIPVAHALGNYPVYVDVGALTRLPEMLSALWGERRLAIISDSHVAALYDKWAQGNLIRANASLIFPAGEASKTRETWSRLSDELLARGFGRDSAIVAIGGGVVGDMAGFVAATYCRGVPYAQVPTTLLAMLDASVGGKVGVDTPQGKNLIGAFHPPAIVVSDPTVLMDLPAAEYRAGFAEAIKHGVIADAKYFEWIETHVSGLVARSRESLVDLIRRSVEIKAEVVSADERESGRRAILNAGHTVAHALETESGFQLAHGEAVALGLIAETRIAEQMGIAPPGLSARIAKLAGALGLPTALQSPRDLTRLAQALTRDKKNRAGKIHLALPEDLGRMHVTHGQWTEPVDSTMILEVLVQHT